MRGLILQTLFLDVTVYDPLDFTVHIASCNRVAHPLITIHWLCLQTGPFYAEFCAAVEASGLVSFKWNFRVSIGIDRDRQQFQENKIE